jgi:putative ABC transport system permease protein
MAAPPELPALPRHSVRRRFYALFRLDSLSELFATLRRNKLRTALTGLAVAWGTFMLVVLLAAGKALENGAAWEFRDDAVNSIWVFNGRTSIPFAGRGIGRQIIFTGGDYIALRREIPEITRLSGRFWLWGEFSVRYRDKHSAFDILGAHPEHRYIEKTEMLTGRFLNERDLAERRKVAVIGELVKESLFGEEDAIGKYVEIRGLAYRVVGVFADEGGENELRKVYVPITTAQLVYSQPDRIHMLLLTIATDRVEESKAIEERVHRLLADRHDVSPDDVRGIRTQNNLENFAKIARVFVWIGGFVWFVSLGTLLAGMIGVSNIMLISVAERTREFGIRKALGATPGSIIRLVLQEALLISSVAGYAGVVAGVGLVELVDKKAPEMPFLRHPSADLRVVLVATGLIVLSGLIAGFIPARRAARVSPMEALREG